MKNFVLAVIILLSFTNVFAQTVGTKSKKQLKSELKAQKIKLVKTTVENKNFVFKAFSVTPMNEKTKTLTTDFGIEIRNDSVFSYMPYFGNTYAREYDNFKDSPMGFIQPIESYKMKRTKSGYKIDVKVNNKNDVVDLTFHISKNGSASVAASSIKRQAITYTGEIIVSRPDIR